MTHYRFFDMVIYHDAIRWWLSGGELYEYAAPVRGQLGFTYPPFAAFVLMPAAAVPAQVAGWLNAAGSVLALTVALGVIVGRAWLPAAVPLALCMEPVRQTLGLGQVNLWLFALVVLDLIVLRRNGSRWTGVGVGIATAVKITPGLFIVYLLVTGQWRAARTATVTVAALTGCGLLLAPAETLRYFGDLLWQTDRVGAAEARREPVPGRAARPHRHRAGRLVAPVVPARAGGRVAPGLAGAPRPATSRGADPGRADRQPDQPDVLDPPPGVPAGGDLSPGRPGTKSWRRSPATGSACCHRSGSPTAPSPGTHSP